MRILVVDDEKLHRDSMALLIAEQMGIEADQICTAANGNEGLLHLKNHAFELAFVDISMPVLSGLEMINEHRKSNQNSKKTKFVIVTGYGEFEYARKAIGLGVIDYLLKPVAVQELKDVLNKVYHASTSPEQTKPVPGQPEDAFNYCLQYIDENYMYSLSLDQLAQKMYFSTSYFCTVFKQKTGMTFNKYLQKVRMEKALQLLNETPMRVYEIAEATGYVDPKYFIRVFKNTYLLTPDEYRRQNRITNLLEEENE